MKCLQPDTYWQMLVFFHFASSFAIQLASSLYRIWSIKNEDPFFPAYSVVKWCSPFCLLSLLKWVWVTGLANVSWPISDLPELEKVVWVTWLSGCLMARYPSERVCDWQRWQASCWPCSLLLHSGASRLPKGSMKQLGGYGQRSEARLCHLLARWPWANWLALANTEIISLV